jgi:hypothetical protein
LGGPVRAGDETAFIKASSPPVDFTKKRSPATTMAPWVFIAADANVARAPSHPRVLQVKGVLVGQEYPLDPDRDEPPAIPFKSKEGW